MNNDSYFDEWLHIQVLDGQLYVFTDDGHWANSSVWNSDEDWASAQEVTFKKLAGECCLGTVEYGHMFRIRLKSQAFFICYGKFGIPYMVDIHGNFLVEVGQVK